MSTGSAPRAAARALACEASALRERIAQMKRNELFVKEAYRRQGLGGDLCAACEDVVRDEWGMDELLLFVDERNDKAIAPPPA